MFEVHDTVYVPYWSLKESKDFQGKRDEQDGIKVTEMARKGEVVGIGVSAYVVRFTKFERMAVKMDMVFKDVQGCESYLEAAGGYVRGLDD